MFHFGIWEREERKVDEESVNQNAVGRENQASALSLKSEFSVASEVPTFWKKGDGRAWIS